MEGRGAGLRSDAHEDGLLISLRCTSEDARELMPLLDWMVTDPHLATEQLELERSLSLQALQRQRGPLPTGDRSMAAAGVWQHGLWP